ncbi:MAG: patatin family protein, partial [Clostridia bacterium]|nr:patatin family protein [Clostridia bacterium]
MKKGLVLEGGAMRGMFTAGVTDVMMENGIQFDGMIGVSAGAAFGCNYKSNQPGRVIRYNMRFCNDPRFCSFRSLIKTGNIYGAEFAYHEIPKKHDIFDFETFASSPMEFHLVCTDVDTGEPVYHKCDVCDDEDLEWIRASASMPLVSKIVEVGGKRMLDGGVSDSIPLEYFMSIGYESNIVVLTQPRNYIKKKNSAMPLAKIMLRKYPKLLEKMAHRHEIYNRCREFIFEEEKKGTVLVICPDEPLPVGHIE